jgi:hypothetical protein
VNNDPIIWAMLNAIKEAARNQGAAEAGSPVGVEAKGTAEAARTGRSGIGEMGRSRPHILTPKCFT